MTSSSEGSLPVAGTVVLLTEEPLQREDAQRVIALHDGEQLAYRVLVPADTHRNLLADVLEHLSLGQLRSVVDDVRDGAPSPDAARTAARAVLESTVASFAAHGREASGEITSSDPVPALEALVAECGAREVVVVTRPRALEETFHRDWASRARARLGVPVLHVYGGTAMLR